MRSDHGSNHCDNACSLTLAELAGEAGISISTLSRLEAGQNSLVPMALSEQSAVDGQDVVALIGNGVSVAFNTELAMRELTAAIIEKINEGGDGDASQALLGLVNDLPADSAREDFEALFGPLDRLSETIKAFSALSHLATRASEDVQSDLKGTAAFFEDVRRTGVSIALETIDERAFASEPDMHVITDFVDAIVAAAGEESKITIANLNYDSLVMKALISEQDPKVCDMADGRTHKKVQRDIVGEGKKRVGHPLRAASDFDAEFIRKQKVLLLHLHGSVSWLRSPEPQDEGQVFRFKISSLRSDGFWAAWRAGKTNWEPVVVLTNQHHKNMTVAEPPFSIAYDQFREQLRTSGRWIIAGYSFRDQCVNDVLRQVWRERERTETQIMVVAHGDDLKETAILDALGYDAELDEAPSGFLTISRGGIQLAPGSQEWLTWVGRSH